MEDVLPRQTNQNRWKNAPETTQRTRKVSVFATTDCWSEQLGNRTANIIHFSGENADFS